jgi:hypothetical protein
VSENKSTIKYSINKYNFRNIQAYSDAAFGQGNGPIMLDDLHCNGNEPDISECPSRGWFTHNCRHREDAGVSCREYTFHIA